MSARMTVRDLQAELIKLGYDLGEVDGFFQKRSKAALEAALTRKRNDKLDEGDYVDAAQRLNVSPAHIKAIVKVEAPRGAFDAQGRPTILYEPHVFGRNSGHVHDAAHPALSSRYWKPGLYGPLSAQFVKLMNAAALDPHAAFSACSWGMFQILGENWKVCGYASPFDMALAMARSEPDQLDAFVSFIKANDLSDKLRQCIAKKPASCVPFVSTYNGPGFRKNDYHLKLAAAM